MTCRVATRQETETTRPIAVDCWHGGGSSRSELGTGQTRPCASELPSSPSHILGRQLLDPAFQDLGVCRGQWKVGGSMPLLSGRCETMVKPWCKSAREQTTRIPNNGQLLNPGEPEKNKRGTWIYIALLRFSNI